LVFLIYQIMNT